MIPKKIHYCWFGRNPLPKSAIKCINSWKKYFPDYEIIEWNEDNYDVNKIQYIKQAYKAKKYAFVSDYARFDVVYQHGGLYFDTDVEVVKHFDDVLANGAFMGCEIDGVALFGAKSSSNNRSILVNPGLGIAAASGMPLYKEILDYYRKQHFLNKDGTLNTETVVEKTTKVLTAHGLKNIKEIQSVGGITIYPKEFFNPLNSNTGELKITESTHSIHWYTMSWLPMTERMRSKLTRPFHKWFGEDVFHRKGK